MGRYIRERGVGEFRGRCGDEKVRAGSVGNGVCGWFSVASVKDEDDTGGK